MDFYYSDDPDDDSVAERIADSSPNLEITVIRQMAGDIIDKVYYKNRLIAIPWDKMQNTVNGSNSTPNFPKHLILKLKKQDAGHLLFSYIPEGIEKEGDEVFAEGQISAELKDGKWHAQTVRLADLDLTRTTPYAIAAIQKIERLSPTNTRIPKQQKIWFIT